MMQGGYDLQICRLISFRKVGWKGNKIILFREECSRKRCRGDSRSRRKIFFCLVVSFPAGWSFVSCLNDIQRMRNLRSIVKLPPWQRIVVPAWNDIDTLGQLCGAILPPRERSDGEIRDPSFRRESQSWNASPVVGSRVKKFKNVNATKWTALEKLRYR